jgi:hypothetical protein
MAEMSNRNIQNLIYSQNPERLVDDDEFLDYLEDARPLLESLCGIPMKDESEVPPIDEEAKAKLRRFARDELTKAEFDEVGKLILQSRSWAKAAMEARKDLLEELRDN